MATQMPAAIRSVSRNPLDVGNRLPGMGVGHQDGSAHRAAEGQPDTPHDLVEAGGAARFGAGYRSHDEPGHGPRGEADGQARQRGRHERLPERPMLQPEERGRDSEHQGAEWNHAPGAEPTLVDGQEPAGQEAAHRQRYQDQPRHHDRGAQSIAPGHRDLDEYHQRREEHVHGDADEEPGDIGGQHRAMPHLSQIDQRVGESQFVGDPHAQQDQGRAPSPRVVAEVQPQPPPSLSTTERPTTTRLSMAAPTMSNRWEATLERGARTMAANTSALRR